MKTQEIERALEELKLHANDRSPREFRRVVDRVDENLDYFAEEPDDFESFYIGCISDAEISASEHLVEVALKFAGFSSEVTNDFYDRLFKTFINKYIEYKDDLFCLEMAIFFAYNYHSYETTKENFLKISKINDENNKRSHNIVDTGLNYLDKEFKRRADVN